MAGYGDEIIATGLARGAAERGRRVAFGDGRRILWGPYSAEIFKGNPNIAPPGDERAKDVEWVRYYKGRRIYNVGRGDHWVWNYDFKPRPGELYFDAEERDYAQSFTGGFVLIEPNVPWQKQQAANKDWGLARYQAVATALLKDGHDVAQFSVGRDRLAGVRVIETPSFRRSMAVLKRAALVICPEGGLHHGAAAVSAPAIVLFGGFIPPEATGYAAHTNLTGGARACGRLAPCRHCRAAMDAIAVDDVLVHARSHLSARVAA